MLESVRILKQLGFTLYASMGTADFYQDNGIDVSGLQCYVCRDFSQMEQNIREFLDSCFIHILFIHDTIVMHVNISVPQTKSATKSFVWKIFSSP